MNLDGQRNSRQHHGRRDSLSQANHSCCQRKPVSPNAILRGPVRTRLPVKIARSKSCGQMIALSVAGLSMMTVLPRTPIPSSAKDVHALG
jgi:hypothetical protein